MLLVLDALQSNNNCERKEIIIEIKNVIHGLIISGTDVSFCWIPSHCGFIYNEWADRAAKLGALNINSVTIKIRMSSKEFQNNIEKNFLKKIFFNTSSKKPIGIPRSVSSMANRILLNSIKTKFCKTVQCNCNVKLTLEHVFFNCIHMNPFLPSKINTIHSLKNINTDLSIALAKAILHSSVSVARFI